MAAPPPRLSDAVLRKLAGADRTTRKAALQSSYGGPISALNHEERELVSRRIAARKAHGPSVVDASAKTLREAFDVDELIRELLSNQTRAIVLDDLEGQSGINDARAAALASALRNNTSVISITLRGVRLTEIGLTSVFESLKRSRSVRAVDLQYVGLTPKAMRELLRMVRSNARIIHVGLFRTGADEDPMVDAINEALHANRMTLEEPKINPYENFVFTAQRTAEGDGFAWDADSDEEEHMRHADALAFVNTSGKLGRPICNHSLRGLCKYGSRCRHFHPDQAVAEPVAVNPARDEEPAFTPPKLATLERDLRRLRAANNSRLSSQRQARQLLIAAAGLALMSFAWRRCMTTG